MPEPDKKLPLDYATPPKRRKTKITVNWQAFAIALFCLGVSIAAIISVAMDRTAGLACFTGFCAMPFFAILSAIYLYTSIKLEEVPDDRDEL